jgi:oligogalacturonide lyase
MAKGDVLGPEKSEFTDESTGTRVIQLTSGPAPSHHPYFTHPCFTPDGRRLLIVSTRSGARQLFCVELESGRIVQATDMPDMRSASGSRRSSWAYVVRPDRIVGVDLDTLQEWDIAVLAPDLSDAAGLASESADQNYVAFGCRRGGKHILAAADLSTGRIDCVLETEMVISHVQCSPIDDDLIMYCDSSVPDDKPKKRIWVIRRDGSDNHGPYDQQPGEVITHESWLGRTGRILFHNWPQGLMSMNPDGSDCRWVAKLNFWHASSDIVGNRIASDTYEPDTGIHLIDAITGQVTKLCESRTLAVARLGQASVAHTHPHPSLSPDGSKVVFDSSATGIEQVYLVEPEQVRERLSAFC